MDDKAYTATVGGLRDVPTEDLLKAFERLGEARAILKASTVFLEDEEYAERTRYFVNNVVEDMRWRIEDILRQRHIKPDADGAL